MLEFRENKLYLEARMRSYRGKFKLRVIVCYPVLRHFKAYLSCYILLQFLLTVYDIEFPCKGLVMGHKS